MSDSLANRDTDGSHPPGDDRLRHNRGMMSSKRRKRSASQKTIDH